MIRHMFIEGAMAPRKVNRMTRKVSKLMFIARRGQGRRIG